MKTNEGLMEENEELKEENERLREALFEFADLDNWIIYADGPIEWTGDDEPYRRAKAVLNGGLDDDEEEN